MNISKRAIDYMSKSEWTKSIKKEKDILRIFELQGMTPIQKLMDFQMNYGGFTYYAYLTPIVFSIIHKVESRGIFRKRNDRLTVIEPEDDITVRHFECADTLYQETFTIDEFGRYYEGFRLQCNNFETLIEDFAMLDYAIKEKMEPIFKYDLRELGKFQETIDENIFYEIKKSLQLKIVDDFPKDIIGWYTDGNYLVWKNSTSITVLTDGSYDEGDIYRIKSILKEDN